MFWVLKTTVSLRHNIPGAIDKFTELLYYSNLKFKVKKQNTSQYTFTQDVELKFHLDMFKNKVYMIN